MQLMQRGGKTNDVIALVTAVATLLGGALLDTGDLLEKWPVFPIWLKVIFFFLISAFISLVVFLVGPTLLRLLVAIVRSPFKWLKRRKLAGALQELVSDGSRFFKADNALSLIGYASRLQRGAQGSDDATQAQLRQIAERLRILSSWYSTVDADMFFRLGFQRPFDQYCKKVTALYAACSDVVHELNELHRQQKLNDAEFSAPDSRRMREKFNQHVGSLDQSFERARKIDAGIPHATFQTF